MNLDMANRANESVIIIIIINGGLNVLFGWPEVRIHHNRPIDAHAQ